VHTPKPWRRTAARSLVAACAAALALAIVQPAPSADASTLGLQAVSVAAAQKGKPYKWGAVGPRAFDCSGLMVYVYATRLHKRLPRTASAQRRATTRISKSQVRPGDLIFLYSGTASNVTHVGVYAGAGRIWHSPHAGDHVKLSTLWTTKWTAGRVP
jgi:cell wall-associated NlpC family hydrolase